MSDTMNKKYLIIILLIPLIMSAVYGHGVDVLLIQWLSQMKLTDS